MSTSKRGQKRPRVREDKKTKDFQKVARRIAPALRVYQRLMRDVRFEFVQKQALMGNVAEEVHLEMARRQALMDDALQGARLEIARRESAINRVIQDQIRVQEAIQRHRIETETLAATARSIHNSILPVTSAIPMMAESISASIRPILKSLDAASWGADLATRMAEITKPWVLNDDARKSIAGFARISRLRDTVHTAPPYSAPVRNLVSDELGEGSGAQPEDSETERDEAAVRRGLNPELISFPSPAYSGVVSAAGFKLRLPPMSSPLPSGASDSEVVFDPSHNRLFSYVEQRVRQFIQTTMLEQIGVKWIKQRVPEALRLRWEDRQKEEQSSGRPVYDAIHYADFMDLSVVILRRDNWRDMFQNTFRNADDLRISFQRLHPIRRALSHSRPLSRSDVIYLLSEATRILSALGISILK